MDCSMPGCSVLCYLPAFAQTHVHWVGDAIQPSHPLSSPSPLAFNLSRYQGLVQWVSSLQSGQRIGVSASASVLPMNIQGWFPLGSNGLMSLLSKGLSIVFSSTTVWTHQFFGAQPPAITSIHDYGKTIALTIRTFVSKLMSLLFNTLSLS